MEAGWEVRWARQAGQMQRLYGHLGLDQPAADPDTEQGPSQLPPDRHTPEQQVQPLYHSVLQCTVYYSRSVKPDHSWK